MTEESKISIDPILKRPYVSTVTGLSKATLYAMIAEGRFPKPLRLSKRAVGWRQSSIIAFLDSLEEA